MMEKNQLKKEGLAFGRSLQRAYKLAFLYSADHPAADEPIQTCYNTLNAILKRSPQFTFGFYNQRVLLNDLLTPDTTLDALAGEFFKRGIMGLTFTLGLTIRDFRRGMGIIATKPEVIEAAGGTTIFLRKNQVEGLRIIAADKKDLHQSDTTLGMDIESFMTAQALVDPKAIAQSVNFRLFMQSSGLTPPAGFQGSPAEMLSLAEQATREALISPEGEPKQTAEALARVLEDLTPDYLLSALPADRQSAYRGMPSGEVAYALSEDVAIQWARNRLGTAEGEDALRVANEEIVQVLGRALRTTQVAERLLQKINVLVERRELPVEVNDRIRHEMEWAGLTPEEQHAQLMGLRSFSDQEFRHLIEYVRQAGKTGQVEKSSEVAAHFVDLLDSLQGAERLAALTHMPDMLRALAAIHSLEVVRKAGLRLCNLISDARDQHDEEHVLLAAALSVAANSVGKFDDLDTALRIGLELDRIRQKDPAAHQRCCTAGIENLLGPATIQKLIEMAIQRGRDQGSSRTISSLLRLLEVQAAEIVFQMLEDERVAANRSKLLHIARQLGAGSFEAASKRLQDERWYVVRNACYVLGALADPDAISHLMPAFSHADPRVQEAAVTALVKGNLPDRSRAMVAVLPTLPPHLQESVLTELILLKDVGIVEPLEAFLAQSKDYKIPIVEKGAQALSSIADDAAADALARLVGRAADNPAHRRALLGAMRNSPHAATRNRAEALA